MRHDYANWTTYTAAVSTPTASRTEEMLEEVTEIINEKIGTFNVNITDTRFTSRLEKLCIRMTDRMEQVDLARGKPQGFLGWSTTDFLQDRERKYLFSIGIILGHRTLGEVGV